MALLRYVNIFDLHFGWEKVLERGQWKARPTHNLKAVSALRKFLVDFEPHIVLLGGDQLNCGPISHWNRGKPILTEEFRLRDELELLDQWILRPVDAIVPKASRGGRKIWMDGNHEAWIDSYVAENPGLEGMIEPRNYLGLASRDWEIFSQGEMAQIGKLYVIHGDKFFNENRGRGPNQPAQKLVDAYHRNIRAGHLHTHNVATQVTPLDLADYHTGAIVPAMCSLSLGYGFNKPAATMCGFECGYVDSETGLFTDYIVIINNGKFTWGGKTYVG